MKEIALERLIDLSVESNLVPDDQFHYRWHEYAHWQFQTLKTAGLRSGDRLLDVGCGALRLGYLAIQYLDSGNYYGVEPFGPYLRLGRRLLEELGIDREYHILQTSDLEFSRFSTSFDYAIAQSVFTHLSNEQISGCLTELRRVMEPGGRLLFTYIPGTHRRASLYYGSAPVNHPEERGDERYETLARKLGIQFSVPRGLKHPSQRLRVMTF